jgi:signal transduction histidine kinase
VERFASWKPGASGRVAAKVAGLFLAFGISWVIFSDILLYQLTRDAVLIARVETAKGWIFVFGSAVLLYFVVHQAINYKFRAYATKQAVLESIADGVLILGSDRRIAYANPAAVRYLRTPASELVGMGTPEFARHFRVSYPDGRIVAPDDYASQRAFVERKPIVYHAILFPPGAPQLDVVVTAAGVHDQCEVEANLVVSVFHDVSMEARFERLRDRFFAAAAHALKTPLAIIKGNAELLAATGDGQAPRATAAIDRQCNRIAHLIDNLLIVARARSGTLSLHTQEVALAPLVEHAVAEASRFSPRHPIAADLVESPLVYADPERLTTALRGLIECATRSAEAGTGITVRLKKWNSNAEIDVRYEAALPGEALEAYPEYDDMGASRFAANAILEAHGGTIGKSTEGSSVTEWIRLPVAA